jgi:hypothetical protein
MATTWAAMKQENNNKFATIADYLNNSLPKDIDALSQGLSLYVQSGGIASDPASDGPYKTILEKSNIINTQKKALADLNKQVAKQINTYSATADMDTMLLENGKLQATIKNLEKEVAEASNDEKAAELRDQILRSRDTNITKHQLFLLGRPLRPSFIPFLWALSVLFIGTGILLYAYFFPIPPELWPMTIASIMQTLSSPWVWGSLFGSACIVIFFLVLKIVGYFK